MLKQWTVLSNNIYNVPLYKTLFDISLMVRFNLTSLRLNLTSLRLNLTSLRLNLTSLRLNLTRIDCLISNLKAKEDRRDTEWNTNTR